MSGVFNKLTSIKPSAWFVLLSIVFGVVLILLIPPFQNPDEPAHTYRAYHLASGHLFGAQADQRSGGLVPAWLISLDSATRYLRNNPDAKSSSQYSAISFTNGKRFADFPNVSYYSPIGYLPFACTAKILSVTGVRGIPAIRILRLTGLFIWVLVGFFFIKRIPDSGDLVLVTGALPGTLALVSAVSPDGITIALTLLWLLMVLEVNRTRWLPALLLGLLFTLQRPNWWPVTWVVFLVKQTGWKTWQRWIVIVLPVIGVMLFLALVKTSFIPFNEYNPAFRNGLQINPGVNPMMQLKLVTEDPVFFLHAFVDTWMDIWGSVFRHLIGKFGWGPNYIGWGTTVLLFVAIFWASLANRISLYRLEKVFLLWTGGSIILITSLILYLQWNEVGASYIYGINGRYLLPLLPILMGAMPWKIAPIKQQSLLIAMVLIVSEADLILHVINRYY